MAEPTLTEVFGANATQTATELILNKADFAAIGLTADANNTAESLYLAISFFAQTYLTEANFDSNINQNVYIEKGLSSFTNRGENNDAYRTDQLTINLAKLDINATLNPDDY